MDLLAIPIHPSTPDNGLHQAASLALLQGLVDAEAALGIPPHRVVVAGFSQVRGKQTNTRAFSDSTELVPPCLSLPARVPCQGGALSLAAAVKSPVRLGGCVALSAWALPHQDLAAHVAASPTAQGRSPFLVCHGQVDGVVTFPNGQAVAAMLEVSAAMLRRVNSARASTPHPP
jgi:predicted esterase